MVTTGNTPPGKAEPLELTRDKRTEPAISPDDGAIEARAKALGTNPNLVTLVQAERWNGVLPTTMVPGSAVPFVSLK